MEITQLEETLIRIASGKVEIFKGTFSSPEKSGHWLKDLYTKWQEQGGSDNSGKRFSNRRLYEEMNKLGLKIGSLFNVLAGKRPLSKKDTTKLMKALFTIWKYDDKREKIVGFPYEQVSPDIDGFVDKLIEKLFPSNSFQVLWLRKDAPIDEFDLIDEYLRDSPMIILASRTHTIIEGKSYADTISRFRNNIKKLSCNSKCHVCWVLSTGDNSSVRSAIEYAEYMNFAIFQSMVRSFLFSHYETSIEVLEEEYIDSIESLLEEEDGNEESEGLIDTGIDEFLQSRACVILEKCKEKTKLKYLEKDEEEPNRSLSRRSYFSKLKPNDILPLHHSDSPLRIATMEKKDEEENWHFWGARRRKDAIFDFGYLDIGTDERSFENIVKIEKLFKTSIDIRAAQLLYLCAKHRLVANYSNKAAVWTLRNLGFEVLPMHDFMRYPFLQDQEE